MVGAQLGPGRWQDGRSEVGPGEQKCGPPGDFWCNTGDHRDGAGNSKVVLLHQAWDLLRGTLGQCRTVPGAQMFQVVGQGCWA